MANFFCLLLKFNRILASYTVLPNLTFVRVLNCVCCTADKLIVRQSWGRDIGIFCPIGLLIYSYG